MSDDNKWITCIRCEKRRVKSSFVKNDKLRGGVIPWCDSCIAKLHTPMATRSDRQAYRKDYQRSYQAAHRKENKGELARKAQIRKAIGEIPALSVTVLRSKEMSWLLWNRWPTIRKAALEEFQCDRCGQGKNEPRFIFDCHAYPELIFAPSNRICWCVPTEMIDVSEVDWSEVGISLEKLREVLNDG